MMFVLTDSELADIKKWHERHTCPYKGVEHVNGTGGNTTYSFTPTGIGTIIKAKCSCGAEMDFTDYESW
jgi:hypothetical protein